MGSIPGLRRSPGEGNSSPLQYSCLEKLLDRGAWKLQSMELQRIRVLLFSTGPLQQWFLIRGRHLAMCGDMFACQAGGWWVLRGRDPDAATGSRDAIIHRIACCSKQRMMQPKMSVVPRLRNPPNFAIFAGEEQEFCVRRENSHTPYRHVHGE